jgi:sugar O-acyltransferase (sialic acid O-acetyltransferase NeuD family)
MDSVADSMTPAYLAGLVISISATRNLDPLRYDRVSAELGASEKSYSSVPPAFTSCFGATGAYAPRRAFCGGTSGAAEKNLIIIGAGQSGREFYTWAAQAIAAGTALRIKGFLDDRADALNGYDYEPGVIGDVINYEIKENDVFVCAIGDPFIKAKCSTGIEAKGGRFINIIHPLANVGLHVKLGVGVVMGPFSSITSDARVGNHVSIGAFSNVAHDTVLGDWCQISSHCGVNGCATLGDGVFLGSHACIIPKVKVGSWAFVGAGSIVVRNVENRVKVFGNPATPIGRVSEP